MYGLNVNDLVLLKEASVMADAWSKSICAFKTKEVKGGMEQWAKEQCAGAEENLC